MKTLEEIASSINSDESYEKAYRRITRKHPWLSEMLMNGYEEMCKSIRLRSDNNKEYLTYNKAAQAMDKTVLTVATIFSEYIRQIEMK